LFKRSTEHQTQYSTFTRMDDSASSDDNTTGFRGLQLKYGRGTPISSYLIFGKTPEAPRSWANPAMEKLGSSVCEHNPMTKFADAGAKLRLLTYVETEMEGCRKRANSKWIAMTRMNASAFIPPCKGAKCCKVSEMVSEKMVCDGGTVAIPTCDVSTCSWVYDCGNATVFAYEDDAHNDTANNKTTPRKSVYGKYGAQGSVAEDFPADGSSSSAGLSDPAKVGIGVGCGALFVMAVIVVIAIVRNKSEPETV